MAGADVFFVICNGTTGGTPDKLDWQPTIRVDPEFSQVRFVIEGGETTLWQLSAGTDAESASVKRPLDYNAITNAKVWKKVLPTGGGGGGSFLSSNTVRVDPNGNDSTGTIGDLSKPFLTVQAAINAFIVAGEGSVPSYATIDIGNNAFSEDLIIPPQNNVRIVFMGSSGDPLGNAAIAFNTLTVDTNSANIFVVSANTASGITNTGVGGSLSVFVQSGATVSGNLHADNQVYVEGLGAGFYSGTLISDSAGVFVVNLPNSYEQTINISAAGDVSIYNTVVHNVTCGGDLELYDSRATGSLSVTGSTTLEDALLNPAMMDFSTLPTDDPGVVGRAWNDSGTVKVSAGPP